MTKIGAKWQNIMSVSRRITGIVPHMIVVFGILVYNDDISSNFFFIFSKFWFFGFLGGRVNGQKMTHNYQFQSDAIYISRTVDHIIKIVLPFITAIAPTTSVYFSVWISLFHDEHIFYLLFKSRYRKLWFSEGKRCNDCASFDTFMKLGMVEHNHLRIGKSMGDKFENQ